MRMRISNIWLPVVLSCFVLTSANAAFAWTIVIDGDINDWLNSVGILDGDGESSLVDIQTIDISHGNYEFGKAEMFGLDNYGLDPKDQVLVLWLRFGGEAFGGSVESTYTIYFDATPPIFLKKPTGSRGGSTETVLPDNWAVGQKKETWLNPSTDTKEYFYADYYVAISGRNGNIERESYAYWDGTKWVEESSSDLSGIEAAVNGKYFELAMNLKLIGDPLSRFETISVEPGFGVTSIVILWGIETSQGDSHDYYPNSGHTSSGLEVFNPDPSVPVELESWGGLKSYYR